MRLSEPEDDRQATVKNKTWNFLAIQPFSPEASDTGSGSLLGIIHDSSNMSKKQKIEEHFSNEIEPKSKSHDVIRRPWIAAFYAFIYQQK